MTESAATHWLLATDYWLLATGYRLLFPLHQLLDLIVSDGALRGDDDRGRSVSESRDRAAYDGGTVGGGFAAEDDARRLDGRDDFDLDRRRRDGVLREAAPRCHTELHG